MESLKRNILVAPLNWGLGHSARCIPIIRELERSGFNPIIASDGHALKLLQKEFPHLQSLVLPSYNVAYPENGNRFIWKMIQNSPKMLKAVLNEKKIVNKWVKEHKLHGIISDNRLGVYSKKIPSVYLTHQLTVLSGKTTWISSKLHRLFIRQFTKCWVPDREKSRTLSGKLGHLKDTSLNVKYLGTISRFEKKNVPIIYDLMVLLSGPEPQRSLLEEKLKAELQFYNGKVVFIQGIIEKEQRKAVAGNITYYNFMTSDELEQTLNQSEIVLCRSGYTTIMDLEKLEKKAFFIPTPGQFEQEYLAKRMKRKGILPYSKQDKFKLEKLLEVKLYNGLTQHNGDTDWKTIFEVFK